MGLDGKTTSSWYLQCVDEVTPSSIVYINVTCFGWQLGVQFASSAGISLKEFLFTMKALVIVVLHDTAAPLMVLTIHGIRLKTSSLKAPNQFSEHDGTALGSLGGLWGLVKFSMAFCSCLTRANNHLISWLWALTSST